jgi:hypothetical protein
MEDICLLPRLEVWLKSFPELRAGRLREQSRIDDFLGHLKIGLQALHFLPGRGGLQTIPVRGGLSVPLLIEGDQLIKRFLSKPKHQAPSFALESIELKSHFEVGLEPFLELGAGWLREPSRIDNFLGYLKVGLHSLHFFSSDSRIQSVPIHEAFRPFQPLD